MKILSRGRRVPISLEESKFYRVYKHLLPKRLRPFALRYQEAINYMLFGGMTTLVNLGIFYPLKMVINYLIANVVAWVGSVIFAFFVNKAFVFEDTRWTARAVAYQAATFFGARFFSLFLEELILFALPTFWGMSTNIVKILAQIVVILVNFIASKFIVFRKKQ